MTRNKIKVFAKEVFDEVEKNNLADASAALSFRSLMAVIPTFALLVMILGEVMGRERVLDWFFSILENAFGTEVVVLEKAVEGTFLMMTGFVFSAIILIVAVWSSVSLVHYVRQTFFSIFGMEISANGIFDKTVKSRALSFMYTILVFFLIVVVMLGQGLAGIALGILAGFSEEIHVSLFFKLINFGVFSAMIFVVFGLVYWFMSAGALHLWPILLGSAVSSLLFLIFNAGLSIYASYSFTLGLFGASSFLVVLLIWIYYSAFTLFLGGVIAFVSDKTFKKSTGAEKTVYI